jgi:Notch-like protein
MHVNNSMTMNLAINYLFKVFIRPFPHIKLTPVTTKEISEIIKSLKWKNSHGYDEIPVRILKISLTFIISPHTYICNKLLSTGIFPTQLKYSQINPIFKKFSKTDISNHRPISLLKSFSEVFEKVIYKRLHYHIKVNNILAKEQYGFMNNSSTEIPSYNRINYILKAFNNKMWVGGILCALTNAFDHVNHNILL